MATTQQHQETRASISSNISSLAARARHRHHSTHQLLDPSISKRSSPIKHHQDKRQQAKQGIVTVLIYVHRLLTFEPISAWDRSRDTIELLLLCSLLAGQNAIATRIRSNSRHGMQKNITKE